MVRAEKEFYDGVEERMKAALGAIEEAGGIKSNYTNVLGLILVRTLSQPLSLSLTPPSP